MQPTIKLAVASLLAAVALAAGVTTATASTGIRLASGTALTITARGPVTITVTGNIICSLDLLIVVNSSIAKAAGNSMGTILARGSRLTTCNGGVSGFLDADVPITYSSFSGTLPTSITGVSDVLRSFTFTLTGGTYFGTGRCQYVGDPIGTFAGPGTSIGSLAFGGGITSSGGRCITPGRITSGLALYANATLGTTLTSVAIALF